MINSHALYRLSYGGIYNFSRISPKFFFLFCINPNYFPIISQAIESGIFLSTRSTDWAMEECKCWRLPIFTPRRQGTIFGTTELNFRVRYGNGWTLCVINTNFKLWPFGQYIKRTQVRFNQTGDSCGNRTRVAGVRGRSLNRLTNEPFLLTKDSFEPLVSLGAPSGARTRDTLIKSQVLYQLS